MAGNFQMTADGVLDLSKTPIGLDYPNCYIKVLDNVFTPEDCAALIALAESDQRWQTAMISTSSGDRVELDYRNSDRILRFDHTTAGKIYQRLLPHIHDILEIKPDGKWAGVAGHPKLVEGTWKMLGVNERLSFLRYGPGHYFKPHCDGQLMLPDGRMSRVTLQIYLNEEGLSGGATRIFGSRGRYLDIEPKIGRVLIFQQRSVYHSGEPVVRGLKYTLRSDFMYEHTKD
ncbi:putative prolyl 4-hydroxylase alpha subunit homolog [Lyophyllum shimeji]|uniref:Prolyl 4-hydroxylase alpha subunit homolog n=1 Tax=Lyophyllum shimeji TaxID=47721 RepID=A0A9P3PV38_LYOSH|nr:putative prolyl 4-hydroxylase alpha subunit homolog [Lyophyllum shimeji]